MKTISPLCLSLLLICCYSLSPTSAAQNVVPPKADILSKAAQVRVSDDIPPLHPWMLCSDGRSADWLGIPYREKALREPINVLICDGVSRTAEEAEKKLLDACARSGFLDRYGHSSDYLAVIDGEAAAQFPSVKKHSFSDEPFFEMNNHGRIFGPVRYKGKFWFCAAFSREKARLKPLEHEYVSFNQARDAFAWNADREGTYRVKKFVNVGNVLLRSSSTCSGDHDGIAVLIEAEK